MEKTNVKDLVWAFGTLLVMIVISLVYFLADESRMFMFVIAYIWFGLALGMMMQQGRFCFASGSRDLFVTGSTRMAVGIVVSLIFFSIVVAFLDTTGLNLFRPGPKSYGFYLAGATLFGVGMVFAGGCASGSLYKCGEGNGTSMLAAFGIALGQIIVAVTPWFDGYLAEMYPPAKGYAAAGATTIARSISSGNPQGATFFIGDVLLNVVLPGFIVLLVVYFWKARKGFMKKRLKEKGSTGIADDFVGFWRMIIASPRTVWMAVGIGLASGLQILVMKGMQIRFEVNNFGYLLSKINHSTGLMSQGGRVFDPGYWTNTTQTAQGLAWVLQKLGINMLDNTFFGTFHGVPNIWDNGPLWMSFGIIFGAFVMARLNNEYKFKPPKGELIFWGLVGGLFMGIGARITLGCNIGAFFVRIGGGDPMGWVFGVGMILGVFIGVKIVNWWTERKLAAEFG